MKIYVSGPMSGVPSFNIPVFDLARDKLRELGHDVTSPADLDEHPDIRAASLASPDGKVEEAAHGLSWDYFIERDVRIIREADPPFDAIVVLPGWEKSRGANREVGVGQGLGARIIRIQELVPSVSFHMAGASESPPPLDVTETSNYDADGRWINHEDNPLRQRAVTGAVKDNRGKPNVELLPFRPLLAVGRVLGFGAKKYKPHNWRLGLSWSQTLGSALRHQFAFADGEDVDPESGECHIDNAITQLLFLSEYYHTRTGTDDRWSSLSAETKEEAKA